MAAHSSRLPLGVLKTEISGILVETLPSDQYSYQSECSKCGSDLMTFTEKLHSAEAGNQEARRHVSSGKYQNVTVSRSQEGPPGQTQECAKCTKCA